MGEVNNSQCFCKFNTSVEHFAAFLRITATIDLPVSATTKLPID